MERLDLDDSSPSYMQVAARLRAAIDAGTLQPGEQLPTHKALADQYKVAVETVKRALGELRTAGLIVTRQGKGSFVRSDRQPERRTQSTDLGRQVEELTRELSAVKERLAAVEARLEPR
ncbi:GntR family transcriptional regulator [Kutzneria kofuensis]|uniref:DNA-binding GntR family transcriptional regulator n=1 Tax=Kutzneria kofuensis TaxID=103725 RepID=A0A7W9KHD9_9PSEU|nr:GntR family transcriptional regulator [Kutzneria kofuensis]MBB5892633.1 DNA-binding GntR family transcriptional regulator [Kutzneria kofuensis]